MSWVTTRLKHLAAIPITNGLGEAAQLGEADWPRYVRTTDVAGPRELRRDARASLPPEVAAGAMLEPGDILICAAGSLGVTHLFTDPEPACYAGYLARFRARDGVDSRFVAYWLQSLSFFDQLAMGAVRSTIENFSAGRIRNLVLSVPSHAEQATVADFLDAETALIDKALARAEALRTLVDERTASVRERLLASTPVVTLVPLRRVATVQTGLTLNARLASATGMEQPYLRVANVQPGSLALESVKRVAVTEEQIRRHSLMSGDVLMTEGGDRDKLGRGVVWRAEIPGVLHQNHVFAVRSDLARLLPEYLEMLLASAHGRRYFEATANQTTNLASTNTTIVGAFPIPTPPVGEQRRIATEFAVAVRKHHGIRAAIDHQIILLRERRQALITAAVTGKLEVPDPTTANAAA